MAAQTAHFEPTTLPPQSRLAAYLLPPLLIVIGAIHSIPSIITNLFTNPSLLLQSPTATLFASFWRTLTPLCRAEFPYEKHTAYASCRGTVLELGPGLGAWVGSFDREKVTKVYAVEPNRAMHAPLREAARSAGWDDDSYVIIGAGIEDGDALKKAGVPDAADGDGEGLDFVVSVQVLCTIPQPEKVLKEVVGRLKSGGELRCVEHVRAQEKGARFVQRFCDAFGWAWVFDGCCLSRDVVGMVKNAGDWREAEVGKVKGEMRWATLPVMVGRFVKA